MLLELKISRRLSSIKLQLNKHVEFDLLSGVTRSSFPSLD